MCGVDVLTSWPSGQPSVLLVQESGAAPDRGAVGCHTPGFPTVGGRQKHSYPEVNAALHVEVQVAVGLIQKIKASAGTEWVLSLVQREL